MLLSSAGSKTSAFSFVFSTFSSVGIVSSQVCDSTTSRSFSFFSSHATSICTILYPHISIIFYFICQYIRSLSLLLFG